MKLVVVVLALWWGLAGVGGQLSKPVSQDSHIFNSDNKFLKRSASNDHNEAQLGEITPDTTCPIDVELKWMTEVSSSVYATPLITDLYSDGKKDIIVPAFVHYLEVLEGPNGAKSLGWPAFHKSSVHSSPLLYDWDLDGVRDIVVATYDGEVLAFKDTGEKLLDSLQVPRLKVRKDWYVGIKPDPVDHSHPDVGSGVQDGADNPFRTDAGKGRLRSKHQAKMAEQQQQQQPTQDGKQQQQQQQQQAGPQQAGQQQQQQQQPAQGGAAGTPAAGGLDTELQATVTKFRAHLKSYAAQYGQAAADALLEDTKTRSPKVYAAVKAQLKEEAEIAQLVGSVTRRRLLMTPENSSSSGGTASASQQQAQQQQQQAAGAALKAATVESDPSSKGGLSKEALESFALFEDANPVGSRSSDASGAGAADASVGTAGGSTSGVLGGGVATGDAKAAGGLPVQAGLLGEPAGAGSASQTGTVQGALGLPAKTTVDEFGDTLPAADLVQQRMEVAAAAAAGSKEQAHSKDGRSRDDQLQDEFAQLYGGDYVVGDGKFPNAGDWEDEMFVQLGRRTDGEFVWVDAHVLCTPAIADIDADGHDELVLAVSYFFDKDYYDNPARAKDLGDVAKDKYVAGGIVVYDLRTKMLKWQQQLDLTTDSTKFKAHIFSSPTLVDVNNDGLLEIVVGTSLGFVYVLDSQGGTLEGWPIQMGEVQGQVLVADLNADGLIEIFAADTLGNIALFNAKGKELWERHVKSMVAQGAVAGDLDGDGLLEIVFGSVDGMIHVVKGTDGTDKPGFPYQTTGRIQAQPTIVQLNPKKPKVQHIAVMSFDGLLYLVDGSSGCAHTVDIGEASYSSVLVDDLDGDGALQLLVSTMNGNVYCLDTRTPYHPLKTWTAQVQGLNGQVARWNHFGIYAGLISRQPRDVAGQKLQVELNIVDERKLLHQGHLEAAEGLGPYNITVVLKGVGVAEMNAGPQPVIGVADTFISPGRYVVEVPCPRTRTTAAVHLDVLDRHGLHYEDEYVVSFHIHFYKLLKWLVALPLLAMAVVLLAAAQSSEVTDAAKTYNLG